MIYIGHFSFDELGEENQKRHGYFTCLVEEATVELATNGFKTVIEDLRNQSDNFGNMVAVYIEDIIEIQQVPRKPLCTRIQSSSGEFPESISRSLPLSDPAEAAAYGLAANLRKTNEADETEYPEMKPFMTFS